MDTQPSFQDLHPIERAGALDSRLRKFLQNPDKILKPYIRPGMRVLDLGCGTGYFTPSLARLVQSSGMVTAIDVQAGMLDLLRQKLKDGTLKDRIRICQNTERSLELQGVFDFVLAFYTLHEVKYPNLILKDLKDTLKPNAKILVVEQMFHVPASHFRGIVQQMEAHGFVVLDKPKIFFSRAVLMGLVP